MEKLISQFWNLSITFCLLMSSATYAHVLSTDSVDCSNGKTQCSANISHALMDKTAPLTTEQEERLIKHIQQNGIGLARSIKIATNAPRYDTVGKWNAPMTWPVVPVHASLLNDGRVLAYDSSGDVAAELTPSHTMTKAAIWNPKAKANKIVNVNAQTGYNLFCSGLSKLPDGRLFVAGGNLNTALQGIDKTHIFNPKSNEWSIESTMAAGRWYPAVTPLNNGEMLITGGGPALSEVRESNGNIRPLTNAPQSVWANRYYPWLQTAPNGKVIYFGPYDTLGYVSTGGVGAWESFGGRDGQTRSYGSGVMYGIGKILVSGGGFNNNTAITIDVNGLTPQVLQTGSMNSARTQHNLTVLADGSVLATGGNTEGSLVSLASGVYAAELWNPVTGLWTMLSSMKFTRQYHSIALLLPDARVLIGGGGICGVCESQGYHFNNTETFLPPYLFKKDGSNKLATRPVIVQSPLAIKYAKAFKITTDVSKGIKKIGLVRPGSVTHSTNMEQRYIPLTFAQRGNTLNIKSPANANIAPPGSYMLFIISSTGTPSISKMVSIR